ncbi:MAG: carboxylesterase family protein [Spirochaetaceae bacterium]|jgi:para-nitrobenzyl esterase|nr:carboxylesterase family protein [Spirochaetaceae bacterium]
MKLSNQNVNIIRGIAGLLCLLLVQACTSAPPAPPSAAVSSSQELSALTTNKGPIQGLKTDGIYTYKGIPYAKAPIGDLRFAPPQDVEPWTEVLDCTKYGPIVTQHFTLPAKLENMEQSEGSLILNIWTPSTPNASDKLPVYVFIHGGGYGAGTGTENTFDGTSFAQNGVVMVTINYRLSTLGFFASQETYNQYGTTGNWGLLDQIKALEWVRGNIAAFGGDPNQVTIGGESAGSWSVSALILSPLAKGLFRSAIMESGTILAIHSLTPARGDFEKTIEVSQILAGIFDAPDTSEGLRQLRQVDASVLNYFSPFVPDQTPIRAFFMAPVFDGAVLPKDPVTALKEGNYNKVNLLIGFNHDEGSLFIPAATDNNSYKTLAARMIGKEWSAFVDRFPVDENNSAAQRAQQLLAYAWFTAGTKVFVDTLSPQNKVFMYNYNFVAGGSPLGAHHAAEMTYAFNTLAIKGVSGAENEKLAQEIHTRWINFIKNGDPNIGITPPTATQWPQYNPAKTDVIFFDKEVRTGPLPDKENLDFAAELLYGYN